MSKKLIVYKVPKGEDPLKVNKIERSIMRHNIRILWPKKKRNEVNR